MTGKKRTYSGILLALDKIKVVTPDGCWLSCGYSDERGRPRIRYYGKEIKLTRLAMHLFKDFDLDSELQINHNIDVCKNLGKCWNPEHLYVGTQGDNMLDRWCIDKG